MSPQPHILVVEDDPFVQKSLKVYLAGENFRVSLAKDGEEMRKVLKRGPVDLVIMDLRLPGEDGFQLTRYLRENHKVGIIILTAKQDAVDKVVGLEIGADDYVTKPWDERELLARIRSVLRRVHGITPEHSEGTGGALGPHAVVRFGGWAFDVDARELKTPAGTPAPLTTSEFNLLAEFVRSPGHALTRDHLLGAVYKRNWEPFDRSIDVLVTRLRRKLERDSKSPELIKTVRGTGYIFTATVIRESSVKQ